MKKAFFSLFLLLAALSAAQNLVSNPGFEEGTKEWNYAAECGEVVAGLGRNGSAGYMYRRTDPANYHILRQGIELTPGMRYSFSAWGRPADAETPVGHIGIILEFSKDGMFLGTQYMDHTPEEGTGWEHYHSEFTAGAEGTSYSLGVYMTQGYLGAFVTDDIAIEPLASEWHFALVRPWGETAQPGDELSFTSIFSDLPVEQQSVTLRFRAGDQTLAEETKTLRPDGTLRFTLPDWQPGDYRIAATLTDSHGVVRGNLELPLKVVAKRDRKVELAPNGSFIVAGQPFYAIGAYSNGHFDNTEHAEMAALGYNCSLAYPMVADWSKLENLEKYVEELDNCERLGLKVIFCLVYHFRLSEDLETFQKLVAPWVERVKDHPSLLAYYLMDEPPYDKAPLAVECRRWLNTVDPNHPVFAVFCNQMAINDFLNGIDCIGTDIYPFGANDVHTTKRQLINLTAIRARGLPVWLVAQSYDMGNVIQCPHYYPTAMEILAQGLTGYVSDAGGLLYWCYYHIARNAPDPEKRLAEMKWAVGILKGVAPFALAEQPDEPPAWMAEAQATNVAWRVFTNGQGEYRLLALSTDAPGRLCVELPEGLEFAGSATGLTSAEGRTLVFQGKVQPDCDVISLRQRQ